MLRAVSYTSQWGFDDIPFLWCCPNCSDGRHVDPHKRQHAPATCPLRVQRRAQEQQGRRELARADALSPEHKTLCGAERRSRPCDVTTEAVWTITELARTTPEITTCNPLQHRQPWRARLGSSSPMAQHRSTNPLKLWAASDRTHE